MAINKTINKSAKSHGAMRNCLEYVLRREKTDDTLTYVTGPYCYDTITWDNIYRSFIDEKKLWNKDNGRMYNHNIISFAPKEHITSEQALEFGIEFAENWFPKHQSLVAVHQDKDHIHIHIVTNTVSYVDGSKLHNSRSDLGKMKEFTNTLCREQGLSIAEKGRHFDGSEIEEGHIISWDKDVYHMLTDNGIKSFVVDCFRSVQMSINSSTDKAEFINTMGSHGWQVQWDDVHKHVTFIDSEGNRVRDSYLSKTFNIDVNKNTLSCKLTQERDPSIDYYLNRMIAYSSVGVEQHTHRHCR